MEKSCKWDLPAGRMAASNACVLSFYEMRETNACVLFLRVKQNSNVCAVAITSAASMLPSWLQMIFTLDLHHCKNYHDQIHVQWEKLCSDTRFQGFQAMFWGLEPSSASCQSVCGGEKLWRLETRPGCQYLHPSHALMTSDSLLQGFPPKGPTSVAINRGQILNASAFERQ